MKYFTVKEIAEMLNVSEGCVYALVDAGKLVPHRIGVGRGTIRIAETDLDEYLSGCRREKTEEPRKAPRPRLKHLRV